MTCFRFIGEVYRAMGKVTKAAGYNQRHQNMAKKLHNVLEIQRSFCNNGILYLDHAEKLLDKKLFLDYERNVEIARVQLESSKNYAS